MAIGSERRFVIGRDAACDVVLADESVSRRHAELLVFDDGMLFFTDCASSRGSTLTRDGSTRPLHQEVLMPRDRLTLGELSLTSEELLELVRRCGPQGQGVGPRVSTPPAEAPAPAFGRGAHLLRCPHCGSYKAEGRACPHCGR
jgi:hypothetical protein